MLQTSELSQNIPICPIQTHRCLNGLVETLTAEIGHWQLRNPHQIMDEERHFVFNRTFALLENATYRR